MKKNSKKFAIIGTLALVAAMFISCGPKEPTPPAPPIDPDVRPDHLKQIVPWPYPEIENDIGIISGNLVNDGDADGTAAEATPSLMLGGETGVYLKLLTVV